MSLCICLGVKSSTFAKMKLLRLQITAMKPLAITAILMNFASQYWAWISGLRLYQFWSKLFYQLCSLFYLANSVNKIKRLTFNKFLLVLLFLLTHCSNNNSLATPSIFKPNIKSWSLTILCFTDWYNKLLSCCTLYLIHWKIKRYLPVTMRWWYGI